MLAEILLPNKFSSDTELPAFLNIFNLLHYKISAFSRIVLFRCTTSSDFLTGLPPSALQSLSFTGILLGFLVFALWARFLLFQCRIPRCFHPLLPFCTNICGVFLGVFHFRPRMAMGRPVQESTQAHAHTHTHNGASRICQKLQRFRPKILLSAKIIFIYSKISLPEFVYVRRFLTYLGIQTENKHLCM